MKRFYIEYFQYNDWANEQIIKALKAAQAPPERCLQLISHVISSQDVWLERIAGNHDWNIDLWEAYSLIECSLLSEQSSQGWLNLIRKSREKDFENIISYKNTKGNSYETIMRAIVTHVLNHSSYHRGQINQLLVENNLNPAPLDYIFYARI